MARTSFIVGVCGLFLWHLGPLVPQAAAQPTGPPPPHPYMHVEDGGLPRIYQLTEDECQRVLQSSDRWLVLPRAITNVLAQPHIPPAFELGSRQGASGSLSASLLAARSSFKNSWDKPSRLIYQNQILAVDGEDVVLQDKTPYTLQLVSGGRWSSYRPFGYRGLVGKQSDGLWCLGNDQGLFWLQDNTIEPIDAPGWSGGQPQGIVADGRGRIVAWQSVKNQFLITVYSDGKWSSLALPNAHQCSSGGIRPDGSIVLAGFSTVIMAKPPAGVLTELSAMSLKRRSFAISDEQTSEMKYSTTRLPGGEEKDIFFHFDSRTVSGTPHVTRTGAALFAVPPAAGNPAGLVRLPVDGAPEWIELDPGSSSFTIAAARDDGFYLFGSSLGIYELKKKSKKPERLAERNELQETDKFLGSDSSGRIYVQRGEAIVALVPQQKPAPLEPVRHVMTRPQMARNAYNPSRPDDPNRAYTAAVDSSGVLWCIDGSGAVLKWRPGEGVATPQDDRLAGAASLWPGRGGAMLLTGGKQVKFVHGNSEVATADSLLQLAEQHFDTMLAAAPLASRDDRRFLPQPGYFVQSRLAAPWLTIGNSLWISDGKRVHRLKREGDGASSPVKAQVIRESAYDLIGPLSGGSLLLAKFSLSPENLSSWMVVGDPGGDATLKGLVFTPSADTFGTQPSSARDDWRLDASNNLRIHTRFIDAHVIAGPSHWREQRSRGILQFDEGLPWCSWNNEVMTGYQVGGANLQRPCRPTYLQRLTPLFADGDRAACLTPLGCAWLQVALESPESDAVVASKNLEWRNLPSIYIGHSGRHVFMISSDANSHSLISFEMPN